MLLSILIPTYNRAKFLQKNILWIKEFFNSNEFYNSVELIVSDNNSSDNTKEILESYSKSFPIEFVLKSQSQNIGLEKNALFCLSIAKGEYIMYLGDDDYMMEDYLANVLKIINKRKDIFCILPSTLHLFPDGTTKPGKDFGASDQEFDPGFQNCLVNARKGSQLSGVVHKREGLLETYQAQKVSNIYPFIFFVGFNSMRGKTLHYFGYPVKVSAPPQNQKDWDYGEDGLLPDIFDNFNKIPNLSSFEKLKLGINFLRRDHWRFTKYFKNGGFRSLNMLIMANFQSKQIPFSIKILVPFLFYFYSIQSK